MQTVMSDAAINDTRLQDGHAMRQKLHWIMLAA